MTGKEAVEYITKSKESIGSLYLLNAYVSVNDVLPVLSSGGYLVCNSWTESSFEAKNNSSLELVGLIRNNSANLPVIEKTNLNKYFEKIDSPKDFSNRLLEEENSDYLKLNFLRIFDFKGNDFELESKYFSLIKLCEKPNLSKEELQSFLSENLNYNKNALLDTDNGCLFLNYQSILPISFSKKGCSSNDLFIFRKK